MKYPLIACAILLALHHARTEASPDINKEVTPQPIIKNKSADTHKSIEEITVSGRSVNLIGRTLSASEGIVSQQDIEVRALLRTGEVLELVPGMVVTQHSGTGKANQYFLRGFNLDHGTDFATFFDDMPINMRTHGHGQGYTDLNFVIPELIETVHYQKGPYYAQVGDFSGAGAAFISSQDRRHEGLLQLTVGEDQYARALLTDSVGGDANHVLWALDYTGYDGPWSDIDENLEKTNLFVKGTHNAAGGRVSWSLMGYDNKWNSADQIPARAVAAGDIDSLGSVDTTTGGQSSRYSVRVGYDNEHWKMAAYAIDYDMNLWSNFTYFLDNPTDGDQFEQVDDRMIYGALLRYSDTGLLGEKRWDNSVGLELRADEIDEVALYHTRARERLGVTRSDEVSEQSAAVFWESGLHWTDAFKTTLGLRYDFYQFDVADRVGVNRAGVNLAANSGTADDGIASVKASAIYTLNEQFETYVSAGTGFHSNDARGTTIQIDPATGESIDPVDPLVRSRGAEWGLRGHWEDRLNMSVALWYLKLDSELLFVGDAGNTEESFASERQGLEIAGYYRFADHWSLDLEYAYTDAHFLDVGADDKIPGAVSDVVQLGLSVDYPGGLFGSVRLRYFGPRPLIESGAIESDSSTLVNARAGYRIGRFTLSMDLLNLLDSGDHDIDYYYESRRFNEPEAVEDMHYHPLEPRTVRLSLAVNF